MRSKNLACVSQSYRDIHLSPSTAICLDDEIIEKCRVIFYNVSSLNFTSKDDKSIAESTQLPQSDHQSFTKERKIQTKTREFLG